MECLSGIRRKVQFVGVAIYGNVAVFVFATIVAPCPTFLFRPFAVGGNQDGERLVPIVGGLWIDALCGSVRGGKCHIERKGNGRALGDIGQVDKRGLQQGTIHIGIDIGVPLGEHPARLADFPARIVGGLQIEVVQLARIARPRAVNLVVPAGGLEERYGVCCTDNEWSRPLGCVARLAYLTGIDVIQSTRVQFLYDGNGAGVGGSCLCRV